MNGDFEMQLKKRVQLYLDYCQYRKELDQKTLKAYRIDLRQYLDFISCDEPNKEKIEEYITDLHKRYKQKTVKRKIATVKAFYNYLEEEELIDGNPFRNVKTKFKEDVILPRIIPREEIECLLNYMYSCLGNCKIRNYKYILRDIAIIEMFFATGARVYEVSNLKTDSVNLTSGLIRIMGKGAKERYIQISDAAVLKILKNYYEENKEQINQSGFFFINSKGKRFTEQSVRLMLKKYTKQAGIDRNITPHMIRHSVATYLIENGMDVSCVREIFGHSSIRTTQIYIHLAAKILAVLLQKTHPRNQMKIVGMS